VVSEATPFWTVWAFGERLARLIGLILLGGLCYLLLALALGLRPRHLLRMNPAA
jgi:hypothetical protein